MFTVALFSHIYLPIATIAFLLHVRRKWALRIYLLSCIPIVMAAFVIWFSMPEIVFFYKGPLDSAGFDSWAVPVAALSVAVICSLAAHKRYIRVLQFIGAFLVANFWTLYAGWLS